MTLDTALRDLITETSRPIIRAEIRSALEDLEPGDPAQALGAEPLWTVDGVAQYLDVSNSWVYQASASGTLPTLRIGGLIRFDPEDIRRFARDAQS